MRDDKICGSARAQLLTLSILQEHQEAEPQIRQKHIDKCNVGAEDWFVHHSELNKDSGLMNCQTQHRASLVHQPLKVTQMISNMEPSVHRYPLPRALFSFFCVETHLGALRTLSAVFSLEVGLSKS